MEIIFLLIGINILVFFLPDILSLFGIRISFNQFLSKGWVDQNTLRDGEFYRLLTATFLHGGIIHLIFNMYYLFDLGAGFVSAFSITWFVFTYFIAGIVGSIFSITFNKAPSVGASGSLFGMIGFLLFFSIISFNTALFTRILFVIILNFMISRVNSRIDNWGHLGGLVGGVLMGIIYFIFFMTSSVF